MLPAGSLLRPDDESLHRAADISTARHISRSWPARAAPEPTTTWLRWPRRCKAPIVHALRGKEYIEYDNPYDVGMTGLLGFASGYKAIKEADVLLMLGTDFPYRQFYPEDATSHSGRHRRQPHRQARPR